MNTAALKGIALSWDDHKTASVFEASRLTITKTDAGFEVRRGGKLLGVTSTSAGARELAGAL